jgi:Zn-dependent protease with chaperone function
MNRLAFILISVCFWIGYRANAQTTPSPPASSIAASTNAAAIDESVPVPVPPPLERAVLRYRTGNAWYCFIIVWGAAVPALFLFSGFSARLRDASKRVGRKWYFALCLYIFGFLAVKYVVDWPLSFYLEFVRAHAYELSTQTFAKWFGDSLKELMVLCVAGAVCAWVPYLLLKKSPRRWWFYAGLAAVPFYFFSMLIEPVAVEPLFNQFTPVKNKVLEAKILTLAERAGIHGSRVFEVNKSVDTRTVNAYVTGFMGTKRIVLWDTALNKLSEHELLFVMGHEMGHYALGHIVKGMLLACVLTFAALYGIHRTAGFFLTRWGKRFGFTELSDFASLPLLLLLGQVFMFVLLPIGLAYSRHIEHEADRFGLEITQFNHSAATGFTRLQEEDLMIPRPGWVYTILRASHPSIGDRIDFFNSYKPWKKGEPMKYEKYFGPAVP